MSGSNVCIWKIEKAFDDIIPLLNKEHYRIISQLESYPIPDIDKRYIYKWKALNNSGFNECNVNINNNNIGFLEAIASIEKPSIATERFVLSDNNKPLPKNMRVNTHESNVIFVRRDSYVYCIVRGPKSLEGTIRGQLMNYRKKDSEWGNVIFRNIPEFTFSKSFYYWILKNKAKEIKSEGKSMILEDVEGFKSSTERNTHSYSGEGSNIDDEIPLKSLVSMDENLESLYVRIIYNKITYSFYLDCDGRLNVMFNECGEHATQNPQIIPEYKILLTIYFDIIPFLSERFNSLSLSELCESETTYRKQKAIEAIREMIDKNGVDSGDIFASSTK